MTAKTTAHPGGHMAKKVLIAHGSTQALKLAVQDLQLAGFDVVATPDGGDAFARFFEEDPDIVVCSNALPSLAGANFARMVCSQSPQTQVFLLVHEGEQVEDAEGVTILQEPLDADGLAKLANANEEGEDEALQASGEDEGASGNVFVLAALKRFQRNNNLLSALDAAGLKRMALIATHEARGPGELVIREGDPGDSFFFVVEGQVRVTLSAKGDTEVARISPGGFFGEMAVLSEKPRSASVWSVGETTLLRFGRKEFLPTLDDYPIIREVISGVALKRTEENLWRTLFDAGEVEETVSGLEEHIAEAALAAQPSQQTQAEKSKRDTAASAEPTLTPTADAEITEPKLAQPRPPPELLEDAVHFDAETEIPTAEIPELPEINAEVAARATQTNPRFGAGIALGAILGAVMSVVLQHGLARLSSSSEEPQTASREQDTANPVRTASDAAEEHGGGREPREGTPDGKAQRADFPPPLAPVPLPVDKPPSQTEPHASTSAAPKPLETANIQVQLTKRERKKLRAAVFEAYRDGKHTKAADLGATMRAGTDVDWEALFTIAQAERKAGRIRSSIDTYQDFGKRFPTNVYADDAAYWAARGLEKLGLHAEARALYMRVAKDEKSNLRKDAQKRLAALPK